MYWNAVRTNWISVTARDPVRNTPVHLGPRDPAERALDDPSTRNHHRQHSREGYHARFPPPRDPEIELITIRYEEKMITRASPPSQPDTAGYRTWLLHQLRSVSDPSGPSVWKNEKINIYFFRSTFSIFNPTGFILSSRYLRAELIIFNKNLYKKCTLAEKLKSAILAKSVQ